MLPDNLIFFSTLFIFNILILTALRIGFLLNFKPSDLKLASKAIIRSLYIGTKFDARLISLITIPALILSWMPGIHLYQGEWSIIFIQWYFISLLSIVLLFYFVDFANFSYLQSRTNASLLALKDAGGIWWKMILQSYPVIRLSIALLLFILFYKTGSIKAI